jgi:hypothetical protein
MIEFPFKCRPEAMSIKSVLEGFDWVRLAKMFQSWSNGTDGYATFHRRGKLKSSSQLGWYYAKPKTVGSKGGILQQAVDAFREDDDLSLSLKFGDKIIEVELTRDNMDNFLKLRYAEMTGLYADKADMNMAQCAAYENWCVKWLNKWLSIPLEQLEPDPNYRQKD